MFSPLAASAGWTRRFVAQGVTDALPAPLAKRIRLTNALSLFAAAVNLLSILFDSTSAPAWMVGEDVFGALAFLALPLLNRRGHITLSRLACLALANLIVLGNTALLGRESESQLLFIALC